MILELMSGKILASGCYNLKTYSLFKRMFISLRGKGIQAAFRYY